MDIAIEQAKLAKGFGVGAAIFDQKGNFIAKAFNQHIEGQYADPYAHIEHAERLAIYNNNIPDGCIIYTTLSPCIDCARALVICKFQKCITPKKQPRVTKRWYDSIQIGKEILQKNGIEIEYV